MKTFSTQKVKSHGGRGASNAEPHPRKTIDPLDMQTSHQHAARATKATATGPHRGHSCPAQSGPFWSDYEVFTNGACSHLKAKINLIPQK